MIDPLSIGLAFLMSTAKDAALSGIIGNRADFFLVNGFKKIKEITSYKGREFPENHDLLRVLRKSMLTATDMLRLSMKVDGEQKQFRKVLDSWINEQIRNLPKLSEWADWNNPAISELELFFTEEKVYTQKKGYLIETMTFAWQEYIASQLAIELPEEFKTKLHSGWYEDGKLITWHEATMVLLIETLRNTNDKMGARASKAFEHNFLSEIKLQLIDIQEKMLLQFPNSNLIHTLSETVYSQQKTIESQQISIENLSSLRSSISKGNLSNVRKELTLLGFKYDECFQKTNDLISTDREAAKKAFMESAIVINQIIQLYDSSRGFISTDNRKKLDNSLEAARDDKVNNQLTLLIEFIQLFDKTINVELASS